jgi:hypothetical protein
MLQLQTPEPPKCFKRNANSRRATRTAPQQRQAPSWFSCRHYFDGVLVRTVANTMWHQPLFLIFDSETMPDWFGMPADADLPSTFSIEYVRAWVWRGTRE